MPSLITGSVIYYVVDYPVNVLLEQAAAMPGDQPGAPVYVRAIFRYC
jgi:hypothetical protein